MIRHTFKWISSLIALFLTVNIILGFVTNVPTHVKDSDESIFRSTLNLNQPDSELSYEQEISLIKTVQQRISAKCRSVIQFWITLIGNQRICLRKRLGYVMTDREPRTRCLVGLVSGCGTSICFTRNTR